MGGSALLAPERLLLAALGTYLVAHVALNEDLSWLQAQYHVGGHTRVWGQQRHSSTAAQQYSMGTATSQQHSSTVHKQ